MDPKLRRTIRSAQARNDPKYRSTGKRVKTPPITLAISARACRTCGCTDNNACMTDDGPCWWVEPDLCSACVVQHPASNPPALLERKAS
jgi:hypothetical protein